MNWGNEQKVYQEFECSCGAKHDVVITLKIPSLSVKQTNYGEFEMELDHAGLKIEIQEKE